MVWRNTAHKHCTLWSVRGRERGGGEEERERGREGRGERGRERGGKEEREGERERESVRQGERKREVFT